jgi:hypothetical protein
MIYAMLEYSAVLPLISVSDFADLIEVAITPDASEFLALLPEGM